MKNVFILSIPQLLYFEVLGVKGKSMQSRVENVMCINECTVWRPVELTCRDIGQVYGSWL